MYFSNCYFIALLVCYQTVLVNSGSVLFIPPFVSPSHKIAMANWADALVDRGHKVYWWAPAPKLDKYQPKNAKYVDHFTVAVDDQSLMDFYHYENVTKVHEGIWSSTYQPPFITTLLTYEQIPFCESIAKNHRYSLDKILSRSYDFIIVDEFFNACGYVVSQILGSPIGIFVSTCRMSAQASHFNNVPERYAYTVTLGSISVQSDQLNLWQRTYSTVDWWIGKIADAIYFKLMTRRLKKSFPHIEDITKTLVAPDFLFLCANQQLELSGSTPHNLVYIGGIQLSETIAPLNEEWENFVNTPNKGFILIATGHWAKWKYAPAHIKQAFVEALTRVPKDYSIIWQYDDEPIAGLPKNIKLSKWLPQRSLLANPNCKLFITHAGCNGLTEALHHAVPMVAIPLAADQPDGAARVGKKGFGVVLRKEELTADKLFNAIMIVLKNESYGINVRKFADNLKSDPMTPIEKAVFWTEFAMRHQGGVQYKSTLKPSFFCWIKHLCIDVLFYFSLLVFVVLWGILKLFKIFYQSFCKSDGVKSKTE